MSHVPDSPDSGDDGPPMASNIPRPTFAHLPVPDKLSPEEVARFTAFLRSKNGPRVSDTDMGAVLVYLGQTIAIKEREFWAFCVAEHALNPLFIPTENAFEDCRRHDLATLADEWYEGFAARAVMAANARAQAASAATAAGLQRFEAHAAKVAAARRDRAAFVAATTPIGQLLGDAQLMARRTQMLDMDCTQDEADAAERLITEQAHASMDLWCRGHDAYVAEDGVVSVFTFGEGNGPRVPNEIVINTVSRAIEVAHNRKVAHEDAVAAQWALDDASARDLDRRHALKASRTEAKERRALKKADKARRKQLRRSGKGPDTAPAQKSIVGLDGRTYQVVVGKGTVTRTGRLSKGADRMTPHMKGFSSSSSSDDSSTDTETASEEPAKVQKGETDQLLSLCLGQGTPEVSTNDRTARSLFALMSPVERSAYVKKAQAERAALRGASSKRKPEGMTIEERLADWGARNAEGGALANLIRSNKANRVDVDGPDMDSVADRTEGGGGRGGQRFYEPITNRGEMIARHTTKVQQKAWMRTANAQRQMVVAAFRGPDGKGCGVYTGPRWRFFMDVMSHTGTDLLLHERILTIYGVDRALLDELREVVGALDPARGICDIPWEKIPTLAPLMIDLHSVAELLVSKRLVPWTLGLLIATFSATPVEWTELDANFSSVNVVSFLRSRKGPDADPYLEYNGRPDSAERIRAAMARARGGVAGGGGGGGGGTVGGGGGGNGGGNGGGGIGGGVVAAVANAGAPRVRNPPLAANQCANCRQIGGHVAPTCPYVCCKCKPNRDGHRRKNCPN